MKERHDILTSSFYKGQWSKDEDAKVIKGYHKFGKNWSMIAKMISGRNGKQVRNRFIYHIEPKMKNLKPFSQSEDEALMSAYMKTPKDWEKIAKVTPSRSLNIVKEHFNNRLLEKLPEYKLELQLRDDSVDSHLTKLLK